MALRSYHDIILKSIIIPCNLATVSCGAYCIKTPTTWYSLRVDPFRRPIPSCDVRHVPRTVFNLKESRVSFRASMMCISAWSGARSEAAGVDASSAPAPGRRHRTTPRYQQLDCNSCIYPVLTTYD